MHCRRQRDGHQTPCETKADRTQRSASRLAAYRLHLRLEKCNVTISVSKREFLFETFIMVMKKK